VERVKSAGAVILGKTNTPEFGLLGETRNRLGDDCRNPWDISKTPGGSSGGAAAALVAGMCALATGSDGGGSIRIPASFTGIYGLKPTQGRVPRYPVLSPPVSNQTSQSGPMARSVRDCALLLQVMAGHDPRDVSSLRNDVPDFVAAAKRGATNGLEGLKIGWTPDFGYAKVDPEVLSICESAARSFSDLGCSVFDSGFSIEDPFELWMVLFSTMSLATNGDYWPERAGDMTDYAQSTYRIGESLKASDFSRAVANVDTIRLALAEQFDEFDLLLSPTMAVPPYECGNPPRAINGADVDGSWACLPFTYPINSAGNPAASIPAGMTSSGLPVGLHIIGRFGDEETILEASAAFEAAKPWSQLRPNVS
ncbi:MAG: amidase family protein, partial [Chloroflexota bacterium]|nr:amidase family protein [Chloroflexota bacterium]